MLGAIFKLSYNEDKKDIKGGICGSCFLVNKNFIITANHVLNKRDFKPNEGYKFCQWWVLSNNFVFEIFPENFKEFPEIDLTLIKCLKGERIFPYKLSNKYALGLKCYNEGFKESVMPKFDKSEIDIERGKIIIYKCSNLKELRECAEGRISIITKDSINANDIKIKNKKIIGLDYGGISGMSGGPLIKKDTGEVIGMMSFGLPPDKKIKDNLFAVSIDEIKIIWESLK